MDYTLNISEYFIFFHLFTLLTGFIVVLNCLSHANLLVMNALEHIKLEIETSSCKNYPLTQNTCIEIYTTGIAVQQLRTVQWEVL